MVFVHQDFKDEIKNTMRPDLLEKFRLKDIDDLPNETIIQRLRDIYEEHNSPVSTYRIVSDSWHDSYVSTLLEQIKSIDDQFFWTDNWLFRWTWLVDTINNSFEAESNEDELFKPGKVVRVCSSDKLRNLNLSWLRDYIGKHYQVVGYDSNCITDESIVINDFPNSSYWHSITRKKVYVKDWFGNYYRGPQVVFVPTSIKDLEAFEKQKMLDQIIDQIRDSQKYEIEWLSAEYQDKLRDFFETSKKLEEKLSTDIKTQAERIMDMQMHTKEILERNTQIANVTYVAKKELCVDTVPLFHEALPIGRYNIKLDLNSRRLKIYNIDIASTETYQHPHIQRNGDCCLGEWMNPLRESYSKWDYVTLIGWIISYLEHLNERSVFISMDERQRDNYKKFKYSIDKKTKKPKEESIKWEAPMTIVIDEAIATDQTLTYNRTDWQRIASSISGDTWVSLELEERIQQLEQAIEEHNQTQEQADNTF